ncbi:MAG: hypothetical protein ABFC57_12860 [Veillonellales bacterium]
MQNTCDYFKPIAKVHDNCPNCVHWAKTGCSIKDKVARCGSTDLVHGKTDYHKKGSKATGVLR